MTKNMFEIKSGNLKKILKRREHFSHKGENGRLLIIGGSAEYHGAPILAAKGAFRSGVDLVYMYVPACNFEVTRASMPDVIVKKYDGDYFNVTAAKEIVEFGKSCDAVLVGPGFGDVDESVDGALAILKDLHLPTVLDSSAMFALKKIKKFPLEQDVIITPHQNEFANLVDRDMKIAETDTQSIILLRSIAMDLHLNVILKGHVDLVASDEGEIVKNITGNAGMTVGGTGDVLAGVAASLLAQGNNAFAAAQAAAYLNGVAGDKAFAKYGYGLMASDVAEEIRI